MEDHITSNKPSQESRKLAKIKQWAEFIRDIGLIIGILPLIAVGMKLYGLQVEGVKAQTEALKAQIEDLKEKNEVLKERIELWKDKYDSALSQLQSDKALFESKRKELEEKIASGIQKEEEIQKWRNQLAQVEGNIQGLVRAERVLEPMWPLVFLNVDKNQGDSVDVSYLNDDRKVIDAKLIKEGQRWEFRIPAHISTVKVSWTTEGKSGWTLLVKKDDDNTYDFQEFVQRAK